MTPIRIFWNRILVAFSLAKKNVIRSPYRSSLLTLGIILTIALETGIAVSIDTLYDDFIYDSRNQNFTDISIIPSTWTNLTNLQTLSRSISSISGVSRAGPVYSLYSSDILKGRLLESKILVYGVDWENHPDISTLNITEGKKQISGNNIIISESLQKMTGFQVEESINALPGLETITTLPGIGFEDWNFTISAIMSDYSFFGNNIGYFFVLVDIETLYQVIPDDQKNSLLNPKIDVSCTNFLELKKIAENIEDYMGLGYYIWIEKDISELKLAGIRAYQAAMNLVILASFVVEFLFITNILTISIQDRSREFGILRAVGSDSWWLIGAITIEILIYSVIGSIFGLISGIWFASLLINLIQNFYPKLVVENLALHASSLFSVFLSGIIVALISGLYPIFIAISMPVVQNIHSRMRGGKIILNITINWKYSTLMGIALLLTGFILQLNIGPSRFLAFETLSIHFFSILLIFLGILIIEITLLVFIPRIGMKVLFWFGKVTRTISMRNISRESQKSLFTIMTSTLALTFIIVVGLVSAAVVAAVPDFFQDQWGKVDLVAEGREGELPLIDFTDDLEAFPGIVNASFIQEKRTVVEDVNSYVFGVDPIKYAFFAENSFDSLLDLHPVYWLNQSNLGTHSSNGTYILISHLLQQKLLLPMGSNLSIQINDNTTVNVTVAAVIKSNMFLENGEYLYLTSNRFKEFFNSSEAKWFLCDVDDDITKTAVDVQASFPQLKEDGVIAIEYYTQALERSLIFQSALFHVLFIESFSLAALSQFMCILVSTLRMEREMGIARSMGLNRRGVFDIFLAESMALGLAGAILGVFDGFVGAILLQWYISLSVPIQILLRADNIVLWFIISLSVSFFSTLLPSYRSSRRNIVAAISGRPLSRPTAESVKLGPFLKEHSFQLQLLFLFLIGILTSKFILDRSSLIIGLIPFDLITQLFNFFQSEDLSGFITISEVFNLNILIPILFSLIIVGPTSFFILTKNFPKNLGKEGVYSFLSGIIGMGLMICVLTFWFLGNSIFKFLLIDPLSNEIQNINWLIADFSVISYEIISSLVIIFLELMMFQIIWTFILSRGVNPDLSLKQRAKWIWQTGSKAQIYFFLIILAHGLIQMVFLTLHPFTVEIISDPYLRYRYPLLTLANPLMFLLTAVIEISFFLLLISYPLLLLKKRPPEFISA